MLSGKYKIIESASIADQIRSSLMTCWNTLSLQLCPWHSFIDRHSSAIDWTPAHALVSRSHYISSRNGIHMVSPLDTKLQIVLLSRELINRSTLMVGMSLMGLMWCGSRVSPAKASPVQGPAPWRKQNTESSRYVSLSLAWDQDDSWVPWQQTQIL